jgi:hypothetical protein
MAESSLLLAICCGTNGRKLDCQPNRNAHTAVLFSPGPPRGTATLRRGNAKPDANPSASKAQASQVAVSNSAPLRWSFPVDSFSPTTGLRDPGIQPRFPESAPRVPFPFTMRLEPTDSRPLTTIYLHLSAHSPARTSTHTNFYSQCLEEYTADQSVVAVVPFC